MTDFTAQRRGMRSERSRLATVDLPRAVQNASASIVAAAAPTGTPATDAAAINTALATGARVVVLQPGTYDKTGQTITVPSNTEIRGAGPGSTIVKDTSTTAAKIFVNSNQAALGNNTNITIRDLTVDRSASTTNDPYDNAIHMKYVDGLTITNVRARGGGSPIHAETCDNVVIVGNRCDSFQDKGICVSWAGGGTDVPDPKVVVAYNRLMQTASTKNAAGSSPIIVTQARAVVIGNTIASSVALGGSCIELGNSCDDVLVHGNHLSGGGIRVGAGNRVRVTGNKVSDGTVSGSALITFANVSGAPTNCVAEGNQVYNNATTGAAFSIQASCGSYNRIANNYSSGLGGYIDVRCNDADVVGNTVVGAQHQGITVASCARAFVSKNVCRNCGQDSGGNSGNKVGFIFDTLTDATIVDNLAVSSATAPNDMLFGHYINASTNVLWRDNDSIGHTTGAVETTGSPTWRRNSPASVGVASAATVTLPDYDLGVINVTGTTGITSITATGMQSRMVTLTFAGILTVTNGSNLKLTGNFTTAAGSALTLACDGTNWYEIGRKA